MADSWLRERALHLWDRRSLEEEVSVNRGIFLESDVGCWWMGFKLLLVGVFGEKQNRGGPAGQIESVSRFPFLEGNEVGNYVGLRCSCPVGRVGPLMFSLAFWRHTRVRAGQSQLTATDLSPEISFLELDLKWVC